MTLAVSTISSALTSVVPFSFERTVAKVDSMAADPRCTPALLTAIIGSDPMISAAIIGRARAAAPKAVEAGHNLPSAITMLGMSMVQGIVRSMLPVDNDWKRVLASHWALANATATMVRIIIGLSREGDLREMDENTLHLCGLLHDLGSIVSQRLFSEDYLSAVANVAANPKLSLHQAVHEQVGIETTSVGTLVARHWGLPDPIASCIRYYPKPTAAGEQAPIVAAVHVARALVRCSGFTVPGDPYATPIDEAAIDLLGLRYGEIETALRLFHEDMDELEVYEGVLAH